MSSPSPIPTAQAAPAAARVPGRRRDVPTALAYAPLALVVFVYLLQLASPLRLNTDAMTYLSITASAADGEGFTDRGREVRFPPGYPAILATTERAGLMSPVTIIALNLVGVGGVVAVVLVLARRRFSFTPAGAAGCATALLFSFVLVKHVTLPLAESVFTAAVMASLYLLWRAETARGRSRWGAVGLAALAILAAIQLRTAGVALVPALLFVLLVPVWRALSTRYGRRAVVLTAGTAAAAGAGLVAMALAGSVYVDDLMYFVRYENLAGVLWRNVNWKLLELGEITLNVPAARLPATAHLPLMLLGGAGVVLAVWGALQFRTVGACEVFAATYAGVVLLWPGYDTRFWLPLLPLAVIYAGLALSALTAWRPARAVVVGYLVIYFGAGLLALGYSTRISLSGADFPAVFGDGRLAATYRLVHHGDAGQGEVNNRALRILVRYEPRSHPNAVAAYAAREAAEER